MQPVEIAASGMVTAVGLTSETAGAAIRAGISRFKETEFTLGDEGVVGCTVPLAGPVADRDKLLLMTTLAVGECLRAYDGPRREKLPLLLCLPEPDRPGLPEGLDEQFLVEVRRRHDLGPGPIGLATRSLGRVGGALALAEAAELLRQGHEACIVAGVDSYLTADTLTSLAQRGRLKTELQANGFIPGEAAAAVLVRAPASGSDELCCLGIGRGREPAPIESAEPLRAEGLFQAIREALRSSGCTYRDLDYRITDVNGEHYGFKEAALAMSRTMRERKPRFEIWHPADSIGEVGAAIGPLVLGLALDAARKGYAPGPGVLCHFSDDGPERAALVLRYTP